MKKIIIYFIHLLDLFLPKKNSVVLRGYPDVEDQCLSLLIALARKSYEGKVTWIVRDSSFSLRKIENRYDLGDLRIHVVRNNDPRAVLSFLTSRYVFFTHGLYTQGDWGNFTPPKNKVVVNLWHGMPIKTIWRLLPKPVEAPRANILLATSEVYKTIMCRTSGVNIEDVWVAGLPRNDMLFLRNEESKKAIDGLVGGRGWLLYLPTYRQSKEGFITSDGSEFDSVLNMSAKDARTLNEYLALVDLKIVVKAHPMSIHAGVAEKERLDNIIFLSDDWLVDNLVTLYELAGCSMGLITDISSIAVDYLLLDRPVFIYFPDRDVYGGSRGHVFDDLDSNLPGEVCKNTNELIYQIDQFVKGNDLGRPSRERLCKQWHSKVDGRFADVLLSRLEICENNPST